MIKNIRGQKITPKTKAQDLLMECMARVSFWDEDLTKGITKKEVKEVKEHIKKQADRIAEILGYNEAWFY